MYEQLLRIRKEVLFDLSEDLTDAEYVIAERAIDGFIDRIEGKQPVEEEFFESTVALKITIDEYDSGFYGEETER